ncbi:SCO6745 family protein [Streptomyces diastaticus]|uniref:SCO6745 family protein n=1 Tax=Streptomyces diastaticus TaxID=1956 RepID=UPI0035DC0AE3
MAGGTTNGASAGVGVGDGERGAARRMWHLLEPLHAVLYYAPEAFEEAAALGYDTAERWPSYFAWRAAPLGPVGAEEVTAAFHSFSPGTVRRHVPASWRVAAPDAVLTARDRAVRRTYAGLLGPDVHGPGVTEAAVLARRVAEAAGSAGAEDAGGPLGAANAALAWPREPAAALWQAATVLREYRGDGHLAALREAGLDPVESLVSFAAVGAAPAEVFASRGWSPAEWTAARGRLVARGLVDADGAATEAGRALRGAVERRTDALAAAPWRALTDAERGRLVTALEPLWLAAIASGLLPAENTLGIGKV